MNLETKTKLYQYLLASIQTLTANPLNPGTNNLVQFDRRVMDLKCYRTSSKNRPSENGILQNIRFTQ